MWRSSHVFRHTLPHPVTSANMNQQSAQMTFPISRESSRLRRSTYVATIRITVNSSGRTEIVKNPCVHGGWVLEEGRGKEDIAVPAILAWLMDILIEKLTVHFRPDQNHRTAQCARSVILIFRRKSCDILSRLEVTNLTLVRYRECVTFPWNEILGQL